jgi:hypothetical protein
MQNLSTKPEFDGRRDDAGSVPACGLTSEPPSTIMPHFPWNSIRLLLLSSVAWVALVGDSPVHADILILHNGGVIRGQWLNRTASPAATYLIETESGGRLTLDKSLVKEAIRQPPSAAEYERIAPAVANTAQEQWKLAEWCRLRQLNEQRTVHLLRIIDLDPDHAAARAALGFSQVNGQWVTTEEWKRKQGFELYRGKWRLAQDIELLEVEHKREQFEREWQGRLKRWRSTLPTDKTSESRDAILAIRDPHAVKALAEYLQQDPYRGPKLLYVESLGKIGNSPSAAALIQASLNDPDEEIFHACVDQLVAMNAPQAVADYVKALKDANNVRVNRAATALARLGDTTAIVPLIDALVTSHRVVIAPPGSSPDAVTTSFSNNGGGFSMGDQTRAGVVHAPNQQVLSALVKLSGGVTFNFDQQAWRNWYSLEKPRLGRR